MSPDRVASVLHAGLVNHYFRSGGYYPEGGGQHLSDRLVHAFEAGGGHLRLRALVDHIGVQDGRVSEVRFHSKHLGQRTVRADIVVSNADLKKTVQELVGAQHFPAKWTNSMLDYEMALPLFVVFLGLSMPPEELPYGNSNRWLFNRTDFPKQYQEMRDGKMLGEPSIYVSTASKKDPNNPGVAPEGHTNVEVMAIVPNDLGFWGITRDEIQDGTYTDNEAYKARKKELEAALLEQYEKMVPGAKDHTVYVESATPMTHMRYVRSSEGSC